MAVWWVLALLVGTPAQAGWVKSYGDQESVVTEEPHEEREISYRTTFDTSSSLVLRAQSVVTVTCTTWTTQTIEVTAVERRQQIKGGQVIKEKVKPLGAPRTVRRDTPRQTEICEEGPASDIQVGVLGQDIAVSTEGQWTLTPTDLRDDQLVRIARGSGTYEVSGASGKESEDFPRAVADWAAASRRQLAEAQGQEYAEARAAAAEERARRYKKLPQQLEAYKRGRNPFRVRWEVNPMDDGLDIVVSRQAREYVRTPRGRVTPQLVGQCSRGQLDLMLDFRDQVKRAAGRGAVVTGEMRLGGRDFERFEGNLSGDGRGVFFPNALGRLQQMTQVKTMTLKITPQGSFNPAYVKFDLDGLEKVVDFLLVACPEPL